MVRNSSLFGVNPLPFCSQLCLDPYATGVCAGLYQQTSSSIESLASVPSGSALPTATLNSTPTSVLIGPGNGWGSGPSSALDGATIAGLTLGTVLLVSSVISSIIVCLHNFHKQRSSKLSHTRALYDLF
ncbi:hypothetical protein BGAL_0231g00170 [Botrytis galanthina]|uniref:Uncharacterized protein n=1 Tax=Botrytis galanthina TaxID=278940 RepID=A0A4S8R686_9HELO|nr:hypothetical protein BGAL_0231g00170 [Botrytis galanthina]